MHQLLPRTHLEALDISRTARRQLLKPALLHPQTYPSHPPQPEQWNSHLSAFALTTSTAHRLGKSGKVFSSPPRRGATGSPVLKPPTSLVRRIRPPELRFVVKWKRLDF
jgi:hypothetical protein